MDNEDIEKKLLASDCKIKAAQVAMLTASLNEQTFELDSLKDQIKLSEISAGREKVHLDLKLQKLKSRHNEKIASLRQSFMEQFSSTQKAAEEAINCERLKLEKKQKEARSLKAALAKLEEYCEKLQSEVSIKLEVEEENRNLKVKVGAMVEK